MQNNPPTLTLDRIFHENEFKAKGFGPARWLDDDSGYTTLEAAPEQDKVKEIVRYALPAGERTVPFSFHLHIFAYLCVIIVTA